MASEDSDQILPGCPAIHRFDHLRDLDQSADIEMPAFRNQPHTQREPFKVALLGGSKRVGLKERDHCPNEVRPTIHDELAQMFAVVVLALIAVDTPDPKEALQLLERRAAADRLRHDKPMRT